MASEEQYMEWFEQQATKISAQIGLYVKEEGGYHSEVGAKFGSVLHEVNGALGNAYTLLALYKHRLASFEQNAVERVPQHDRWALEKMIAEFRLAQTGEADRWASPTEVDEALAEAIIKAGWVPPSEAPRV